MHRISGLSREDRLTPFETGAAVYSRTHSDLGELAEFLAEVVKLLVCPGHVDFAAYGCFCNQQVRLVFCETKVCLVNHR